MKCDMCGKGRMVGKQHKHHPGVAGGRWKKRAPVTQKIFKPNLHSARILVNGMYKRMRLCTKCLRKARLTAKRAKEAMKIVSEKKQIGIYASVPQSSAVV